MSLCHRGLRNPFLLDLTTELAGGRPDLVNCLPLYSNTILRSNEGTSLTSVLQCLLIQSQQKRSQLHSIATITPVIQQQIESPCYEMKAPPPTSQTSRTEPFAAARLEC